jgi:hypothetical protein
MRKGRSTAATYLIALPKRAMVDGVMDMRVCRFYARMRFPAIGQSGNVRLAENRAGLEISIFKQFIFLGE